MLQILQTRILSVVAWYHLAFFAISMAMFGLTAGAVFVYLRGERFTEKTLSHDLAYYSVIFAIATSICLCVQMTLAPVVIWSATAVWTWMQMAICLAIPFGAAGVVVSLALTRSPFPVGRVYAIDLFGAAAGCLGALLLLNLTDGPSGILWVAAIGAVAATLFATSGIGHEPQHKPPLSGLLKHRWAITLILMVVALANGATYYGLQPLVAKGKFESGDTYIFRAWNTFSRVSVTPDIERPPELWGPSPKLKERNFRATQRELFMDSDAATSANKFNGNFSDVEFLKYDVTNLAYFLPNRQRAAVIGVGGGRDVLSAAAFGYRDITGVELNPVFVDLLTRRPGFADFTNLSTLPGVRFIVDEGRSWFARSQDKFDLIQMSLIDTWAATGAGAFSLSENGLYTTQAWKVFFNRLSDRGVYTVSRWYDPDEPAETTRLLSLASAALLQEGVRDHREHLVLAAQESIATLIVSKRPFTAEDLDVLRRTANQYEHKLLVMPGAKSAVQSLEQVLSARDVNALYADSGSVFDLTPPTDNRPFFFNQIRLDKPIGAMKMAYAQLGSPVRGGVRIGNFVATGTLLVLFTVSLVLVLLTIVIPLRSAVRDVGRGLAFAGTSYFLLIGIGFMLVEIALLQSTSVFLGHPVYSLSVLLFTLILSTGAGSFLSEHVHLDSRAKLASWALLASAYIFALPTVLGYFLPQFEGASLIARAALCVACMVPAGLLMGFAFPTGMRLVSQVDRGPTPWFWGVNGAAGVLASTFAIACSIAFGISTTLRVGSFCYLLLVPAALLLFSSGKVTVNAGVLAPAQVARTPID